VKCFSEKKKPSKKRKKFSRQHLLFLRKMLKIRDFFVELKITFTVSLGIIEVFLLGVEKNEGTNITNFEVLNTTLFI
jgi:hypothetical protein